MTHPLDSLFATIDARRDADPGSSYTAQLLQGGMPRIARKLGEEAIETVIEALAGDRDKLAAESADLLYHLMVLWAGAGLTPQDIYTLLEARNDISGLDEKKRR
jgi:phosphoribosyl-ATP pyrophosphohydrolase